MADTKTESATPVSHKAETKSGGTKASATNATATKADAVKAAGKRVQDVTDTITKTAHTARQAVAERASQAGRSATETLDSSPLAALAGAIAIGAVAAAFIPTSRREIEALGPWAEKLREAAAEAFQAAREAGTGELTAAGLTVAAASDGLGGIVGKIVKAATASMTAATSSVTSSRGEKPAATTAEPVSTAPAEPAPLDA